MRILIAEDDIRLNEGISYALANEDRVFVASYSWKETIEKLSVETIDFLILDVNFPDGNGIDILKFVKKTYKDMKVILLTANNLENDIVLGLELGADDYITKPFSLMVLRARVNVQIRNIEKIKNTVAIEVKIKDKGEVIQGEDFYFDFSNMIFYVKQINIELSKTEQKLLKVLAYNQGITIPRKRLMEVAWSCDSEFVEEHALTVTMKRLRDKLGNRQDGENRIKTIYGLGYAWVV